MSPFLLKKAVQEGLARLGSNGMLTVHDIDEDFLEAIGRGAEGFLSKNMRAKDLLNSLRGVMS